MADAIRRSMRMRLLLAFVSISLSTLIPETSSSQLSQPRTLQDILFHVKTGVSDVLKRVKKVENDIVQVVNNITGTVMKITDELIHHGLRLEKLGAIFAERNLTHYREQHKHVGLLKQLIPDVLFDSVLAIADPILLNIESGLSKFFFQGDIILTDDQMDKLSLFFDDVDDKNEMEGKSWRKKRQITKMFDRWTDNTLYYFVEDSVDANTQKSVQSALKYIEDRTCLSFKYDKTSPNRVRVFPGTGCYSSVGMIGGQQDLSLGEGCSVIGTVAHEFTHALGVWHTQMRDDRDKYVTIDLDAVEDSAQANFAKLDFQEVYSVTPYEYGSFMHYASNSFSKDKTSITIVPNESEYVHTMGNRMISFYDMLMLNHHYECQNKCSAKRSAKCVNGGYPNPNDCKKCVCPLGYGGSLCDQLPDEGGEVLTATNDWQTYKIELGENTTELRDDFITETYWIIAPHGYKIEIKILNMYNSQCQISCPYNGIEIKKLPDIRVTNPRICCPEYKNILYTSENNPTPIITYNRFSTARFTITYRYVQEGELQPGESSFARANIPTRGERSSLYP